MLLTLAVVGVAALGICLVLRVKRLRDQHQMEKHSISAEELHALLASDQEVLLFDVRQPRTSELCESLEPLIPQFDAILMSNHGVVTYADTLHHAYMKMETVEHFARIALVTHCLGRQQPLGQQDLESSCLRGASMKAIIPAQRCHWQPLPGFPRGTIAGRQKVPPEPVRQESKTET